MIAATFIITLDRKFLPMQLTYGGKILRSIPTVKFPRGFLLSTNPQHYSNEEENLKLLKEVIVSYLQNGKETLCLDADYPALLIMDVVKGQITPPVLNMLKANNIFLTKVPENITNLYQPLDLTANGNAKSFMKRMFTKWFASKICEALESGKAHEEIDVKMNLSMLKPLQAGWII